MKVSKEQIKNINCKCNNNWEIDIYYLINWNEKILKKQISIDKFNYLEYTLSYNAKNQIQIRVNKYHIDNGVGIANGLGKKQILDNTEFKRKNIIRLIEYTNKLTDDELMKIKDTATIVEATGVVPSDEF